MTERDWLTSDNPAAMLTWLCRVTESVYGFPAERGDKPSDRKLRLFACACLRSQAKEIIPNGMSSILVAERFADGDPLNQVEKKKHGRWAYDPEGLQHMLSFVVGHKTADKAVQAALLLEIIGNPYRPIHWCDILQDDYGDNVDRVRAVAKAIYDTSRFEDMPILADALEDAGCDDAEILSHLRGPVPHVRGCHVLDLLLGNS